MIDVRYNMAPFSTFSPHPPRFSTVALERFPRSRPRRLNPWCSWSGILLEDSRRNRNPRCRGGYRCAGITAAAVALADAGIPMRDMIVGVASGKIEDTVVLDLDKAEDNYGRADLPRRHLAQHWRNRLLANGWRSLSSAEYELAMEYNFKAAREIHDIMVDALQRRYEGGEA